MIDRRYHDSTLVVCEQGESEIRKTLLRPVTLWDLIALYSLYAGTVLVVLLDWLGMYEFISMDVSKYTRAVLLAVFVFYVLLTGINLRSYGFRFGRVFTYLIFLCLIYSLMSEAIVENLYSSVRALFWLLGTVVAYRLFFSGLFTEQILRRMIIMTVIIATTFNILFVSSLDPYEHANASAYLLLLCIPLLLIVRRSILIYICIAIASIAIIITVKRGALVGLILSSLAYVLVYLKMNLRFRDFVRVLLAFVVLVCVLYYASLPRLDLIMKRFEDTSGSGRDILYTILINHYRNAEIKNQIFGFGINSVQEYTGWYYHGSGTSAFAHSDWLQFLHDFGVIGIIILTWFHLQFLALIFQHYKNNSPHAPPLLMGYVILFLVNIYSGQLMSPNAIYLGLLLAFSSQRMQVKRGQTSRLSKNKAKGNTPVPISQPTDV